MNEEYLKQLNKPINIDITPSIEVETDEMWGFYHDKKHQDWLWWAVDHDTHTPLAYVFGTREHCHLEKLLALLKPFPITQFYTDNNYAYSEKIDHHMLTIGKKNTQAIERCHLTLRTRIKRLQRKTICFSKSKILHEIVIGIFINRFFFHTMP